jgi:hypothetical protein
MMAPQRGHLRRWSVSVLFLVAHGTIVCAHAADVLGRHGDWRALKNGENKDLLCFAITEPKEMEPKGANRDQPYLYVSAWPAAGVKGEVSVKMGYPVKKGSAATANVDGESFAMFSDADRLFVSDPTQELKLIEALRKGATLTLKAVSERGTTTTDTYSLSGASQALQTLAEACK